LDGAVTEVTADRSVRTAWVADAEAIGALQSRAWRGAYAGLLPAAALDALDPAGLGEQWAQAVRRPPSARHRVLVALDRATVVGFAAVAPSEDPDADPVADAELTVLVVDPQHQRAGHGSRLLAAVADTCRADRFRRLSTWLLAGDDALRRFLESTGWAPDGAHREMTLDDDTASTRQVRLHTDLADT
jgi:GNAT superfamily N-acetyltransferase